MFSLLFAHGAGAKVLIFINTSINFWAVVCFRLCIGQGLVWFNLHARLLWSLGDSILASIWTEMTVEQQANNIQYTRENFLILEGVAKCQSQRFQNTLFSQLFTSFTCFLAFFAASFATDAGGDHKRRMRNKGSNLTILELLGNELFRGVARLYCFGPNLLWWFLWVQLMKMEFWK